MFGSGVSGVWVQGRESGRVGVLGLWVSGCVGCVKVWVGGSRGVSGCGSWVGVSEESGYGSGGCPGVSWGSPGVLGESGCLKGSLGVSGESGCVGGV